MKNSILILGSGTSTGVPILGCSCKICQSDSVKNKRMRTSILIRDSKNKTFLIDTTPDLRSQLLREKINHLDAALITHEHADHCHGVDDLRAFCYWRKDEFPLYTSQTCLHALEIKFPYIFKQDEYFKNKPILGGGLPRLKPIIVEEFKPIKIFDLTYTFFHLPHGHIKSMGFICEKMAYLVDCVSIPEKIISMLTEAKLDLLILDLNGNKPHTTHLHLDKALDYAKKINAKLVKFIHINHDHDHEELSNLLISKGFDHMQPTFDGEELFF